MRSFLLKQVFQTMQFKIYRVRKHMEHLVHHYLCVVHRVQLKSCHGRHAYFWICFVYSSEGASLRRRLLTEGSLEVAESENCVVLTLWLTFFPPQLRSGTSATPIRTIHVVSCACVCPARVQGVQTALRGPHKAKLLRGTISEHPAPGPSPPAAPRVTTRRLHNQMPSAVSVPLKIPRYKVRNVFLARPDTEHNDIFRDRPWLFKMQCL